MVKKDQRSGLVSGDGAVEMPGSGKDFRTGQRQDIRGDEGFLIYKRLDCHKRTPFFFRFFVSPAIMPGAYGLRCPGNGSSLAGGGTECIRT